MARPTTPVLAPLRIAPGAEAAFGRAAAAPRTALQVVFPVDWSSFHATDSIGVFVEGLDESAQQQYAVRKQAFLETIERAEFYDAECLPELSYEPD